MNSDTIEMIHLVLEGAREKSLSFDGVLDAMSIEALEHGALGPHDSGVEPRHTQASLFFELHAFAFHETRIDHDDEAVAFAADADVDDEDSQRHAELSCSQADARRGVHRFDHVVDQPLQAVVEPRDIGRRLMQRRSP